MTQAIPMALDDEDKFSEERFHTFRLPAIRLALFVASLLAVSSLIEFLLRPAETLEQAPARAIAISAILPYPAALFWNLPRRWLPWVLYGSTFLAMLLTVGHLLALGGNDVNWLWTVSYFLICTPVQGMPLSRRQNIVGILVLFLAPNALLLLRPGMSTSALHIDTMAIPLVIFMIYMQHSLDRMMKTQYKFKQQIVEMAHRDALTGLYNRRYFMEAADLILKRTHRTKAPLCLLMLDIDHFKKVNDTYGHPAGDLVIGAAARTMTRILRESDLVARFGGEEFVGILLDADRTTGLEIAERVRVALEGSTVPLEGPDHHVHFTASLGLALIRPAGDTLESLLERADHALYEAKGRGRNQSVIVE